MIQFIGLQDDQQKPLENQNVKFEIEFGSNDERGIFRVFDNETDKFVEIHLSVSDLASVGGALFQLHYEMLDDEED